MDYLEEELAVINAFLYPESISMDDLMNPYSPDDIGWDGDENLELFEEYDDPAPKSTRARRQIG